MSEADRIRKLLALFSAGAVRAPGVVVGNGDDAAVLGPVAGEALVVTVDAQVEDVHFRRGWLGWEDCGWRSFVAAASDVSAMGASPWCALSALTLTMDLSDEDLERLALGQRAAADAVGASVVGGNLSSGAAVTLTTTVLGRGARTVQRSGAREGDGLFLAGEPGLAGAGLRALALGITDRRVEPAILAWRKPVPRTSAGIAMGTAAHAAIDVSDGVALDASRLAYASHVSVVLERDALLAASGEPLRHAAEAVGAEPFDLLLAGGEDYALLAASDVPIPGFTRVGEVRAGRGLIVKDARGEAPLLRPRGFDHFPRRS